MRRSRPLKNARWALRPGALLGALLLAGPACGGGETEPPAPICGDAICNGPEDCQICGEDCGACAAPGALPPWIGVSHGTVKFRPRSPLPRGRVAEIEAARDEFEPYQIVIDGGAGGRTIRDATASPLVDTAGPSIGAERSRIHAVGLYEVSSPSNLEGAPGPWPDPLIPLVDPFYGERRAALPLFVPPGERRALWVDVHVPPDAPAGRYAGGVTLSTTNGVVEVPVSLRVFDFTLPPTASLRSAFGLNWNDACTAHHGGYEACGADNGIEHYNTLYAQAALDHRVTLSSVVYAWPRDEDWAHFDEVYGPLLEGHAETQLVGAKLTTLVSDTAGLTEPAAIEQATRSRLTHLKEKAWAAQPFHYTCDEPPDGCAWPDIAARAGPIRAAGMPTLVTTDLARAVENGVDDRIDILAPLMNWVHPEGRFGDGPEYLEWCSERPTRQFWWYQSCISHGCGNGCDTTPGTDYVGWPSYVIDASAIQARAMEWFSFEYSVEGELYFATTHSLTTAWQDQCAFSGSGDGTLFYPGTPDRIGGQHDIPIMSLRWKMIREGMEDYEYLHRLAELGDGDFAMVEARRLFPFQGAVTESSPEALLATRRRLAERIEQLSTR